MEGKHQIPRTKDDEKTFISLSTKYFKTLGQILKPLRTSTNENEDNFLVIGEIKNIKMKPHPRFHRYFKGALHTLS